MGTISTQSAAARWWHQDSGPKAALGGRGGWGIGDSSQSGAMGVLECMAGNSSNGAEGDGGDKQAANCRMCLFMASNSNLLHQMFLHISTAAV
jgi:hypothetical protein